MGSFLANYLDDLLFFGGLALLGAGLYFVYPPLALIVPGAYLTLVGLMMGLRRGGGSS